MSTQETGLQVVLADAQLTIVEFFSDVRPQRKELIKALVKAAWHAGHTHALHKLEDRGE